MATIRAYTTIEQSRKLAEILPIESADMVYTMTNGYHTPFIRIETIEQIDEDDVLCWSLAALLGVLPEYTLKDSNFYGKVALWCQGVSVERDNPIDACYEMILKLHELNLL